MTGVAAGSVVNESLYSTVLLSDRCLIAVLMASDAREDRIVRAVGMAITALGPLAIVGATVNGEIGGIVRSVFGAGPIDKRVAGVAGLSETGCRVTRIGGVVVVSLMAAPAVARSRGVVVADVTQAALVVGEHRGVIAGE